MMVKRMSDSITKKITYFSKTCAENTGKAIELALERAREGDIRKVVIATSSGDTGLKAYEAFKDTDIEVIPVLLNAGSKYSAPGGGWTKNKSRYDKLGLKYIQGIQAFSGVERAVNARWGTVGPALLMSDALRIPCEGFKVCVEVTLMAADSGFVVPDEKVIAIAGTGRGADTVMVVKPAYSGQFFDFAVNEILCKPIVSGIKHEAK